MFLLSACPRGIPHRALEPQRPRVTAVLSSQAEKLERGEQSALRMRQHAATVCNTKTSEPTRSGTIFVIYGSSLVETGNLRSRFLLGRAPEADHLEPF